MAAPRVGPCSVDDPWPASSGNSSVTPRSRRVRTSPTLCGDWTVRDLLAHLLVRERSPLGAAGIQVASLAGLTDRAMEKASARDFPDLVEAVRKARTPLALPLVDDVVNTLEFFVHHEDIRRAQPGWEPRNLTRAEESALWTAIKVGGRGLVRPAGVPVTIRRADGGATAVLRGGSDPVVVTGLPSEIVLFLFGRRPDPRALPHRPRHLHRHPDLHQPGSLVLRRPVRSCAPTRVRSCAPKCVLARRSAFLRAEV